MDVAFLLHLYQPPTQSESVFRQIYNASYYPLVKLLKNNPDYKMTLNTPLSLLELMEKYGYTDWIHDVHDLIENERVEITGSAAYHPLLTKIPEKMVYENIILNEYGLGYYYGSKHGFEGESSILIKNIKGFFPPELALNEEVIKVISDLGYEWVMGDKCAIPDIDASPFNETVFKYKDLSTYIVIRDCELSNALSFKRNSDIEDVLQKIIKRQQLYDGISIALDGEAFGHHNNEGIYVLDSLLEGILKANIQLTTVSEMVYNTTKDKSDSVVESNWSELVCTTEPAKLYKLWDNKSNKIQQNLWSIQTKICEYYSSLNPIKDVEGAETLPLWHKKPAAPIGDAINKRVELNTLVNKSLHSDQFWWASKEILYDKTLFSPEMISKALDIYKEIAVRLNNPDLIKYISGKSEEIEKIIS